MYKSSVDLECGPGAATAKTAGEKQMYNTHYRINILSLYSNIANDLFIHQAKKQIPVQIRNHHQHCNGAIW